MKRKSNPALLKHITTQLKARDIREEREARERQANQSTSSTVTRSRPGATRWSSSGGRK